MSLASKTPRRLSRSVRETGDRHWKRRLFIEPLEARRLLAVDLSGFPDWVPQGPSPSIEGQVEEIDSTGPGDDPVIGAIHTLALHPTDSDIAFLGGTNGGVWRTTNFTSGNPTYEPLIDQFRTLSTGALEFDPTDASNNTLFVGIGRYSSFGGAGGDLTGLLRTTDGGDTWAEVGNTTVAGLQNRNVSGVGPRGNTILVSSNNSGVFRSLDGGATFQSISGVNGLPFGNAFDLIGDPTDNNRFYVSIAGTGIFRTDNLGNSWTNASSDVALNAAFTAGGNNNAEMAVSPTTGRIFAGVLVGGRSNYIGYSDDQGATWTEMDLPVYLLGAEDVVNATNTSPIVVTTATGNAYRTGDLVRITGVVGNTAANGEFTVTAIPNTNNTMFSLNGSSGNGAYVASAGDFSRELARLNPSEKPGGQGRIHFSIIVDPNDDDIVYIGGDRQDSPFPNPVGAGDFSGNLFRGDASVAAVAPGALNNEFSPQWEHLTHTQDAGFVGGGTSDDSAPHADSREMRFRADGVLVEVDDGGIYARTSPTDNTGLWFSKISDAAGGLQVTEMHDVAYDNNANIIISGNQDTGTTEEIISGGLVYRSVSTADGGDVAVDNLIGGGNSLRYSSTQNLGGFRRRVMNAANGLVSDTAVGLASGGDPAPGGQFVTPIAVNEGAANRLIIGASNGIYESSDRGDNVARISTSVITANNAIAYGTAGNPEALYVGVGGAVLVRTAAAGPLNATAALGGGNVTDIDLDPNDFRHAVVVTSTRVFETLNAGAAWTDITGNLSDPALNTVELVTLPSGGSGILAGGRYGVHRMLSTSPNVWTELGTNLPNAPVWDMDYDLTDDRLVVGTLGRGAWTVENTSLVIDESPVLTICGDENHTNQDDVIRLMRNAANPLLLDVFLNSVVPTATVPLAAIMQINVFGVGGNDELIVDTSNGLIDVPTGIRYNGDGACHVIENNPFAEINADALLYGYDRGFDTLTITTDDVATAFDSEEVAIGQLPGSGRHTINDAAGTQTVWFEELEPMNSIVNAASFAITSIPGLASLLQDDNQVTYEVAQILAAPAGRVTVDNFEPIEFSNKTNVVFGLGSGNDYFVGKHAGLPAGLQTITVNGDAGEDSIQFEAIPDASATTFVSVAANGGVGDDLLDARSIEVETPFTLSGDEGHDTLIGGRGDDTLNGGDGSDLMAGGDPRAFATGFQIGDNVFNGGADVDTMAIFGTEQLNALSDDLIFVTQTTATTLVRDFNTDLANETFSGLEQVRIEAFSGDDLISISIDDALFVNGNDPRPDVLRYRVVGGDSQTGDVLRVFDDGLGDTILQRIAQDINAGTFTIAPAHPLVAPLAVPPQIIYEGIEFAEVADADPLTGATGTDDAGRWVVFKPDPFEPNSTLPNATFLGADSTINVDPTVDGGLQRDRDFYQVTAGETGALDYRIYFEDLPALTNGRGGLPGNGDLAVTVYDSDGTVIGTGTDLLDGALNVIGLRFTHGAVEDQTYYLRVDGETTAAVNVYNLTVENEAAPVPSVVDLQAASDSGRHDSDDVTNVVTSTFDIIVDDDRLDRFLNLNLLPDTSDDNTANAAFDYGVQVFNNEVSIGFAFYTGVGNTWQFTAAAGDLLEGHNNFIEAAVWVRDSAAPEQIGRGELGGTLQVTLDTVAPIAPSLLIDPATTDTGVAAQPATLADRITSETAPGFVGNAEADAIVRMWADGPPISVGAINASDVNQGLTVAVPIDGDEAFPGGYWSLTGTYDLNDPSVGFPLDGLRQIAVDAEDLAGNRSLLTTLDIFIDTQGPQVTNVQVTGSPAYDLFDVKPTQGPTPAVNSLSVSIQDLPSRVALFLYDALQAGADGNPAENPGHYQVVGDHNGNIDIASIDFIPDPVVAGIPASGTIVINFAQPLPDDRFTLTISDAIVDPAGNSLDGDSNAAQPNGAPTFPSGDGQPGGDFVTRFTVDSRAEIGVFALGSVYIDTNGNYLFDPEAVHSDDTNEDIVYKLGFQTDNTFAGNFVAAANGIADGFDKLGTYGQVAGQFRWLIDTNNNGVPDLVVGQIPQINGRPAAGNFDGNAVNGDEVALKDGPNWFLDTNHDFIAETTLAGNMIGLPVVGDWDGDGIDDLGAWADDVFSLDLSGIDGVIDGFTDVQFTFGFPGVREIPVAADFNGDGVDDLGLWNPDAAGVAPGEQSDWMILVSQPATAPVLDTAVFSGANYLSTGAPFGVFVADDFVPIDVGQTYQLSGEARSGNIAGDQYQVNNRQYLGFASYDSDQLLIEPIHISKFATATDTQLAVALNPGDTQIVLQDATGWANAGLAYQRSFAWYGYTNSDGFTYPDYTYTRNIASNFATGLWSAGGVVGNVITLNAPWAGPVLPAGMAVRNATSGGTFNYAALSGQAVPDTWTQYSASVSGTGMGATQFRPGTAFIKPIVLTNYIGGSTNLINWRNIEVSLPAAAVPITDRIVPDPQGVLGNVIDFTPVPFGPDLYASFGDEQALPVVGNFDPPVVGGSGAPDPVKVVGLSGNNADNGHDVDGNGLVEPHDVLLVVNHLNRHGVGAYAAGLQVEAGGQQWNDGPLPDVDGDGMIDPYDALSVVNLLNRMARERAAQGEGSTLAAAIATGPAIANPADASDEERYRLGDELAVLDASSRKVTGADVFNTYSLRTAEPLQIEEPQSTEVGDWDDALQLLASEQQ